jgi:glycosyltransferase involved in cell wall biosynthesis
MIEDGHTGFLVNEPTAAALADALNITLSLPATRLEEVGHNARISSHRWHPDSILPQVLSYYAEVLAEQQSGSAV